MTAPTTGCWTRLTAAARATGPSRRSRRPRQLGGELAEAFERGLAALAAAAGRDQHAGAVDRRRAGARAWCCRPRSRCGCCRPRRPTRWPAPRPGRVLLERDLAGVDPDREGAQGELNNALDRLTNAARPTTPARRRPASSGRCSPPDAAATGGRAGRPRARRGRPGGPARGRSPQGTLSRQYVTLTEQGVEVPTLLVGQPVRTAGGDLEFYLLFPLDRRAAHARRWCRAR